MSSTAPKREVVETTPTTETVPVATHVVDGHATHATYEPYDAEGLETPGDPGIEEHVERYTDVDRAAANRATRLVVFLFGVLAPLMGILFLIAYFAIPKGSWIDLGFMRVNAMHFALGTTLGLGVLALGIGLVHWAKQIMGDHEISEERHYVTSNDADRAQFAAEVKQGYQETGLARRKVILASLLGGVGMVVVPALFTLGDLGPAPIARVRKETLMKTLWSEGVRIVNDVTYRPIKASDMEIGQLINAEPENLKELHGKDFQNAKAKAALIVVRMDPNDIHIPESRRDWHVNGILAYSKICTHVGCPISLWEQQTHHLLCPCHQSTFDLGDSGLVVFGPAARALPQLPITVDKEGYLIARSDFTVPVGPSFFERDSRGDYKKGDR